MASESLAARSGRFTIGGDMTIHRLGYGTMQLPGPGVWGPPRDHDEAIRVLRRSVDLGVNFFDTADSYGPVVAEQLLAEALHPYQADIVIATKAGLTRQGPGRWAPVGRPAYLRQQAEMSLRNLQVDRLDLFQLHRIDHEVPLADQIGELADLQGEGKIRHIGLSEVSMEQLLAAQQHADIVSVQNLYNLSTRSAFDVLEHCERNGIGFIPWFPLATGRLTGEGSVLEGIAARLRASPAQVALAWLLHRSPVMLPIPGTSTVAHLEDNMRAATLELTDTDMAELEDLE